MQELQDNALLRLVVQLAEDDGVAVSAVLGRGLHDAQLRLALKELRAQELKDGTRQS